MKLRTYITATALALTSISWGQSLEDLQAPSMPAATMIGSQVNEIARPKSLKALETSLLNNFMDSTNKFVIPDGYALEVNPFMLTKRRGFNYEDYLENDIKNFVRNISVSLASTNSFLVNDSVKTNGLGFGIRSILYNGKVDDELREKYLKSINKAGEMRSMNANLASWTEDFTDSVKNANKPLVFEDYKKYMVDKMNGDKGLSSEEVYFIGIIDDLPNTTSLDNLTSVADSIYKVKRRHIELENLTSLMEDVKMKRYGFRVDFNAAMGLSFPTNDFYQSYVPKYGAWLSASYRIPAKTKESKSKSLNWKESDKKATPFEIIGMLRVINVNGKFVNSFQPIDTLSFEPGYYFDAGLRLNIDYNKFSVGFEYIYRQNRSKESVIVDDLEYSRTILNDGYKFNLNLNYNIKDNIVLSYNLGKNYNIDGSSGDLISGFTLNLGIGGLTKEEYLGLKPAKTKRKKD